MRTVPPKKKRLTPAMRRALDLLEKNKDGVIQRGTEHVIIHDRDPETGRRLRHGALSVSNQTLLALQRRGLVRCVHLLPDRRLNAKGRDNPKNNRRRWRAIEVAVPAEK